MRRGADASAFGIPKARLSASEGGAVSDTVQSRCTRCAYSMAATCWGLVIKIIPVMLREVAPTRIRRRR